MKRKSLCILLACLLVAVWAEAKTVTVTDMAGRSVAAPFDPERIVCLGPGALRLIVYLQAESKVCGVENMETANPGGRPYWLAHPKLAALPRCGPGGPASINKKPDLEAVLSVVPQVIFVTYMEARLADEVQRTLGIPVVVLSYGAFATFDEAVYDALRIAGKVLNRANRADSVVGYIETLRKDLQRRTQSILPDERAEAYVGGIGYRGAHGIESSEQQYAPLEWVGAKNLAKQVKTDAGSHVFVDREALLKINPEVIFIDGGGLALVAEDYQKKPQIYNQLRAFAEGKVYVLHPFNWYTTNIGTVLVDAYMVGKTLYAGRFEKIDPEQKAKEIYRFLVGKPVYQQMKKDYGAVGRPAPFLPIK